MIMSEAMKAMHMAGASLGLAPSATHGQRCNTLKCRVFSGERTSPQ
jgi:hypothetical protein